MSYLQIVNPYVALHLPFNLKDIYDISASQSLQIKKNAQVCGLLSIYDFECFIVFTILHRKMLNHLTWYHYNQYNKKKHKEHKEELEWVMYRMYCNTNASIHSKYI